MTFLAVIVYGNGVQIKRAGKTVENFGAIRTEKALRTYFYKEGWEFLKVGCLSCGNTWQMVVNPFNRPRVENGILLAQPCIHCQSESVTTR